MANKRMFSISVVSSDTFISMSLGAQALYFHFGVHADDDGFVGNPKTLIRMVNANQKHYGELIKNRFIIPFESGVIAIRHWKTNNYLRSDRYTETVYLQEKKALSQEENGNYVVHGIPNGIPNDNQMATSGRPSIDSIDSKIIYIVNFLNSETGKSYRASTPNTQKMINARLKEGFTVEDFKTVIKKKTVEWQNTDMEKYLRPSTLFCSKHFEEYLQQSAKPDKKADSEYDRYQKLN